MGFFKKNIEYICLAIVIVTTVCIQLLTLGNNIKHGIELINTLDFSWQLDIIERFQHGYIAGRDFIFTYGPLFQFIYSLPSLVFKQPSYVSVLYAPILLTVFNIIFLFFTIKIATNSKKNTLILTILLLFATGVIGYDQNALFRIILPFFYGMLLFKLVSVKTHFSIQKLIMLLLPAFLGTYSFDLFILCLLIIILFVGYEVYTIYQNKKTRAQLKRALIIGSSYILLVSIFSIFVSLVLTQNLNYLFYSLDTIKNYQFVMNIPWSANKYFSLLVIPFGLCLFLLYVVKKTKLDRNLKTRFIILTTIALLQLKSAFIRADDGHILMGIYPSIIVLCIIGYIILSKKITTLLVSFFLIFYLINLGSNHYFNIFSLQNFGSSLSFLTTKTSFFTLYRLPRNAYFNKEDLQTFKSYIINNPGKVMIYPHDNYLLNIYGNTYNTFPLQFYAYSNTLVEQKAVEELQRVPPKFIILGIDDRGAVRLDNIPNFSRNPLIAKWMLENYDVEIANVNYLILRYDKNKKATVSSKNTCTIFSLNTTDMMQGSFFERLIKSSTFYLDKDTGIRLPYMPKTSEILFVENFNNFNSLKQMFGKSFDFNKYHLEEKRLKIIKKYPFPKITKTFESNYSVKCYY